MMSPGEYGLGIEPSVLSPLELGVGYRAKTGESGRWMQYGEGLRDPLTGRYRGPAVEAHAVGEQQGAYAGAAWALFLKPPPPPLWRPPYRKDPNTGAINTK